PLLRPSTCLLPQGEEEDGATRPRRRELMFNSAPPARRGPDISTTCQKGSVLNAPEEEASLRSSASRRWGGRRIHDLDDGGLWSSDEAGVEENPGVLVGQGVDPARLLAARRWTAGC